MRWASAVAAVLVVPIAGAVAPPGGAVAASPRVITFLGALKGTADVSFQVNGNLFGGGGCHADVAGEGHETFSLSSIRPQPISLYPYGRGKYMVYQRNSAPVRVTVTRAGTYAVTFPSSNPAFCSLPPHTLTAPTSGCGSASGRSASMIFSGGVTGASGRSSPWIEVGVGGWGFEYFRFPWVKKLGPCPSSMNALLAEGTGWSEGRRLWPGGGGLPYEKAGTNRVAFPAAFWTKTRFAVSNRFIWSFRALNVDAHQIGKETQTISWKITFRRKR